MEEIQLKITKILDNDCEDMDLTDYTCLLIALQYEIGVRLDAAKNEAELGIN